jgi:hypothetical protein
MIPTQQELDYAKRYHDAFKTGRFVCQSLSCVGYEESKQLIGCCHGGGIAKRAIQTIIPQRNDTRDICCFVSILVDRHTYVVDAPALIAAIMAFKQTIEVGEHDTLTILKALEPTNNTSAINSVELKQLVEAIRAAFTS